PALLEEYGEHYHKVDLWSNAALIKGRNTPFITYELTPESVLSRSEHSEFFGKADIFYLVGSVISVGAGEVGLIGVHHERDAGDFSEADRRKMELLIPHLRRALQMRSTIARHAVQRDMVLGALDGLA